MMRSYLIKDIMTRKVAAVFPETAILEASRIMVEKGFNGLPVIDKEKKVIGIITEYDLLTKGTALHLPTFIRLFAEFSEQEESRYLLQKELKEAISFMVKDVMNTKPLTAKEDVSIAKLVQIFSAHHSVNPIPIVDAKGILKGIVSRCDVIKFYAHMLKKIKSRQ